jgi:hypothetical protein
MVKSERKFGFIDECKAFFSNVPESVDQAILDKSVRCPDRGSSLNCARVYQNLSIIFDNLNIEICRDTRKLIDVNNRPLLCELQDGGVASVDVVFWSTREALYWN